MYKISDTFERFSKSVLNYELFVRKYLLNRHFRTIVIRPERLYFGYPE